MVRQMDSRLIVNLFFRYYKYEETDKKLRENRGKIFL